MKKHMILVISILILVLVVGACTPRRAENLEKIKNKAEDQAKESMEELNSQLEEMSQALEEESKKIQEQQKSLQTSVNTESDDKTESAKGESTKSENITEKTDVDSTIQELEKETTDKEPIPTFELGADALPLDAKDQGYRVKIEGDYALNNTSLTINIQNTGKNAMESDPAGSLATGHTKGHIPLYYLVKDDNLLIIKTQGLKGNNYTVNLDLQIKELSVDGHAKVNLNCQDMLIEEIEIDGLAEINAYNIDSMNFDVELEGAGRITGAGIVDQLNLEVKGAADVDFSKLITMRTNLEIEGTADIQLSIKDNLTGYAYGANNIGYYGSPEVTLMTGGSSTVPKQLGAEIPD